MLNKSCIKKVVVAIEYNYYRLKVNLMFLIQLFSYLVLNAFLLYFARGYLFWNTSFKIISTLEMLPITLLCFGGVHIEKDLTPTFLFNNNSNSHLFSVSADVLTS